MPNLREESKTLVAGYEGEYSVALDDKNRLTLPAAFRRVQRPDMPTEYANRFVMTRGLDGGLALYPIPEWRRIEETLMKMPFTERKFRFFNRMLHSKATEVIVDKQGRIPVSKDHKDIAGIDREALVVGGGRWIEIWNKAQWDEYVDGFGESWEETAESLQKKTREERDISP